jgi:hypothetical protein
VNKLKGFSLLPVLLFLVVGCLIVFTGYYVWGVNKQTNNSFDNSTKAATSLALITKKAQPATSTSPSSPPSSKPAPTKTTAPNTSSSSSSGSGNTFQGYPKLSSISITAFTPKSSQIRVDWQANSGAQIGAILVCWEEEPSPAGGVPDCSHDANNNETYTNNYYGPSYTIENLNVPATYSVMVCEYNSSTGGCGVKSNIVTISLD